MLRPVAVAAIAILAAACGDPDSTDTRGYTKAPLENPGWTVDGEEPTRMSELGDPIRIPSLDTGSDSIAEEGAEGELGSGSSVTPEPAARPAEAD